MKWYRFYNEVYRDPKVQDLRAELFRFWVNFMCVASESEPRGQVTSEAHLRRALGLSAATVRRYCSDLEGALLLHRSSTGALVPHNWELRQPDSDDSAKRKRDQRERTCVNGDSEMSRDTSRDTSRDKNVTRVRALLDSDSDTEEIKIPLPPSVAETNGVEEPERVGASDLISKPIQENPPDAVAALAVLTEARWPAQDVDHWVGDLCRDFDYRLAAKILDQAFDRDPKKLSRQWVRGGCQAEFRRGWKPEPAVEIRKASEPIAHNSQPVKRPTWIDNPDLDGQANVLAMRREWDAKGFPRKQA